MSADLYAALSGLRPGDAVPPHIYVSDYADGRRPVWRVAERAELGAGGVRLDLEDAANGDLFEAVRVIVLTFPAKTLRTPPQPHGLEPAIVGGKLCDMAQQGRAAARKRGRA